MGRIDRRESIIVQVLRTERTDTHVHLFNIRPSVQLDCLLFPLLHMGIRLNILKFTFLISNVLSLLLVRRVDLLGGSVVDHA